MPLKSPRMMSSNNANSGVMMNFNGNGPITNHIYYINFIHQHQDELAKQIEYIFAGSDENIAKNMFNDVLERVNEEISEDNVKERGTTMKEYDYIDQVPVDGIDNDQLASSTTAIKTTTTSKSTTTTTTSTTTTTTTTTTSTTTTTKSTATTTTKAITMNVVPIITLKIASEDKTKQ